MKINKYIYWTFFMVLGIVVVSCDEEDDVIPFDEAANDISFPDYPAFSASFTSLDDVVMDVNVEGPATSLDVSSASANYGSVAISGGTGTFTRTLAELGLGEGDNVELSFEATSSRRLFDLSISSPLTEGFTTGSGDDEVSFASSTSTALDSTYTLYFEAATVNGVIDNYEVYTKVGSESEFSATPDVEETVNALTITEESVTLTADDASVDLGDTIFYQIVINRGSSSSSIDGSVNVGEISLDVSGTVVLRTPDYIIEPSVLDSLNNAFNFSALKVIADSVLQVNPDSADVQLDLVGGDLTFVAGTGSNTEYVLAENGFDFENATYESVRDAYNSQVSTSSVNVEVNSNPTILVRIGNIPSADFPSSDNKRYAVISVTDIVRSDNGVTSEVTFDYKAPTQAD